MIDLIIGDTQYFYVSMPPSSALQRAKKEGVNISSELISHLSLDVVRWYG